MKTTVITLLSLPLLAASSACTTEDGHAASGSPSAVSVADSLAITRRNARDIRQAPSNGVSGSARIESLFPASAESRSSGVEVSFVPGSRTVWHTHPRGQILVVTAGVGRVQRRGGPVEEIREGDVVSIAPRVEHWHGAAPTTPVTHIAIQQDARGAVVELGRPVNDADYATDPLQRRKRGSAAAEPTDRRSISIPTAD